MKNTITLTDEQMKALQSGQSITIEPPKPVIFKWEPKKGNYKVYGDFSISYNDMPKYSYVLSGTTYQTQAQAEQSAEALRSHARQLAWLSENDDGWVADWDDSKQCKYFINFDIINNKYCIDSYKYWYISNVVYMSYTNAEKLCGLLTSGIVEF